MTETLTLRECPACKKGDAFYSSFGSLVHREKSAVECRFCGLRTGYKASRVAARGEWNALPRAADLAEARAIIGDLLDAVDDDHIPNLGPIARAWIERNKEKS